MLISSSDKIFVAGHKGMLGKAIVNNLIFNGYKNLFLSDRSELDLFDFVQTRNYISNKKIDVVVLAAAKVGGIRANLNYPAEYLLENLKIQNNVIEAAWQSGVRRLLFIGSSCIYPKFSKQPIREEELLSGHLESSLEPYALAKISGIKLCEALRKQYGFDAISVMPSNMYGPGDNFNDTNSHVLASLLRRFHEAKLNSLENVLCWGTGNVYREFLFAEDCADACRFCLENWDPDNNDISNLKCGSILTHLNVGNGTDLTIKDLATLIASVVGFKGEIIWDKNLPDGTPRKLLDISRIRKLGWMPRTNLEDGINYTYQKFLKDYQNKKARL